ncbi:hypothetical protein ICU_00835 [Bacillus cereus BAG2X1-1]|nr:hypothetical protein ICU_00835 [Bacillus cereus BAG2X1-1]
MEYMPSFLFFSEKEKNYMSIFSEVDIPRNLGITAFVNHLFFLGKSKEENMTENRKNCCCKMKINKVY